MVTPYKCNRVKMYTFWGFRFFAYDLWVCVSKCFIFIFNTTCVTTLAIHLKKPFFSSLCIDLFQSFNKTEIQWHSLSKIKTRKICVDMNVNYATKCIHYAFGVCFTKDTQDPGLKKNMKSWEKKKKLTGRQTELLKLSLRNLYLTWSVTLAVMSTTHLWSQQLPLLHKF